MGGGAWPPEAGMGRPVKGLMAGADEVPEAEAVPVAAGGGGAKAKAKAGGMVAVVPLAEVPAAF